MLVIVLTLAALAVTAFFLRQRWAAAAPEQPTPRSRVATSSSRIPGQALGEAIARANQGLSSEGVWSRRPATEPSAAIAGFPGHPSIACFACFEAEHRLNRGVVRKLYTNEDVPTWPIERLCIVNPRPSTSATASAACALPPPGYL